MKNILAFILIVAVLAVFWFAFMKPKKTYNLPPDPVRKEEVKKQPIVIPEGTADWGCDPKNGKC